MRELILLRHANALPGRGEQADFDRALSEQGLLEAEAAADWLQQRGLIPDRVLCSPARRTRETLEPVLAKLGYVEQRLEDCIYEASANTLAALLQAHHDAQRLLLVGHNPGLETLTALLSASSAGGYRGMPTAAIAVLQMPDNAPLTAGSAQLSAFFTP